MSHLTKSPNLTSLSIADSASTSVTAAISGSHKLVNRAGVLSVKDSLGNEVILSTASSTASTAKNYLQTWFNSGVSAVGAMQDVVTETGSRGTALLQTSWVGISPSASSVTIGTSGETTLRGSNLLATDGTGVGSLAGTRFVETPTFTLDGADIGGRPVYISFDVLSSIASGDWDVVVMRYNSAGVYQSRIPVVGKVSSCTATPSAKIPTGTTGFFGYFVSGTTATDLYAVRFRRLANAVNIRLDSLAVFPKQLSQGAFASGWSEAEATTIVSTGGGLVKAATRPVDSVMYRYVTENTIQVLVNYRQTGAGTAGTGVYALKLPNNFTFDTNYMRPSIFTGVVANYRLI